MIDICVRYIINCNDFDKNQVADAKAINQKVIKIQE